jgi:tripartite-type tricarboxylate transporter receptor subunit TctC
MFRKLHSALAAVALLAFTGGAQAADWKPDKPIRLVIPFGPGGATDVVSRIIAAKVSETIGQPVVVENRAGGGGLIGMSAVRESRPDGYTLLVTTIGYGANPALYRHKKIPYDPLKDFTLITRTANIPTVLVVPPSLGVKTLQEFIDRAKANPGTLSLGSAGYGTVNHLAGELFKAETGINTIHVPYRSGGLSIAAVVSGEISGLFATTPTALGHIKNHALIPLAMGNNGKLDALPDVEPTAKLVPGFDVPDWQGLLGPAGLPRNIVDALNAQFAAALKAPEVIKRLADLGAMPATPTTPEEFATFVTSEVKKWNSVADRTGMKAEN